MIIDQAYSSFTIVTPELSCAYVWLSHAFMSIGDAVE